MFGKKLSKIFKNSILLDTMIAIVEIGSKQYQVKAGDIIDVDHQDIEVGQKISLNVLLTATED